MVVPYTKGLSESFKRICGKHGIQTYFRGTTTIKQTLMKPKDQDPKDNKSGLIYSYKHQDITCREEYIGEASRSLGDRCKEHLKGPSPIHSHIQCEAIYIRVNNPSLNRNVSKYHLSHLWNRVLFNIPGLKIDSTQHPLHIHNNGLTPAIPTNNNSPMATGN